MPRFLDWDPLRGLAQYEDRTIGGNLQLHYRQDVEPILDLTKYERNNGLADKAARQGKQDFNLYARIPPVIQLEMKYKHGVDINNKDHHKKMFQLLNQEYPHLKTTDKTHK